MSGRRISAAAAFAFRCNARLRLTRAGVAAGLAIVLLGPILSLRAGDGWKLDTSLAFFGFLVALTLGVRSGLEEQREYDLDLFLTHNILTPIEHAIAMMISLLATWLSLLAALFVALLAASAGDLDTALWHTAAWGLRSAALIGLIPLVERFAKLRVPAVLPALAYFFTLIALTVILGEVRAMEIVVVARPKDPTTLVALAQQGGALLAAGMTLQLAVAALEGSLRGRSWSRRRGTQVVASRH